MGTRSGLIACFSHLENNGLWEEILPEALDLAKTALRLEKAGAIAQCHRAILEVTHAANDARGFDSAMPFEPDNDS